MSSIKEQILTLVKQRHHSHKVALEQEKDPRSKHAIDLIARIREDSQLIDLIDSLPEEKLSYVTDSPGDPGNPGEPGISDLEKAAEEYGRENVHYWYDEEIGDGAICDDFEDLKVGFIAGAEWQKDQMAKDAVEGEIGYWNQRGLSIRLDQSLERLGYDEDTKVKIIIVKQ